MLPWPNDTLRAVSERYKSLNEKLVVAANMAGELKLRVEADEVKVETKWKGLNNPPLGTIPPPLCLLDISTCDELGSWGLSGIV